MDFADEIAENLGVLCPTSSASITLIDAKSQYLRDRQLRTLSSLVQPAARPDLQLEALQRAGRAARAAASGDSAADAPPMAPFATPGVELEAAAALETERLERRRAVAACMNARASAQRAQIQETEVAMAASAHPGHPRGVPFPQPLGCLECAAAPSHHCSCCVTAAREANRNHRLEIDRLERDRTKQLAEIEVRQPPA